MSRTPRPRDRRAAFTLVELLVVIGIIALLISILLPALSAARRQANFVKCSSNMHQIGLGLQMYAQQYQGRMPGSFLTPQPYTLVDAGLPNGSVSGVDVYWWQRVQIEKFLPGVSDPGRSPFVCPSSLSNYQPFNLGNSNPSLATMCNCSYGINNWMTCYSVNANVTPVADQLNPVPTTPTYFPATLRRAGWPKVLTAPNAPQKILVAELLYGVVIDWTDPNTIPNPSVTAYPYYNGIDWRRHASASEKGGRGNILYLDGHVSSVRQNPNGIGTGMDPVGVVNDINGTDYHLGATVAGRMTLQSQPY